MNKKRLYAKDYGILPSGPDGIRYVGKEINRLIAENPRDTEIVFDPGDYYIRPTARKDYRLSNTTVIPNRAIGIFLEQTDNVTLDFSGSALYFEGQMQPFTLDRTVDTTVKNLSVDWKRPLSAEGVVVGFSSQTDPRYIDLYVDPALFPHRFDGNWLSFDTGNGEWYPLNNWSHIQFDSASMTVRRNSGDSFVPERIEDRGNNVYRFYANHCDTAIGNVFVLRLSDRIHAGIFAEKCVRTTIENVRVYSCGGLGCLAQFCRDITFNRVVFEPNRSAGRRISNGHDDGMHITCCSGTVVVNECTFAGLMDDPVNVHGCCVTVESVTDDRTVVCRYRHEQATDFLYYAEPGDEAAFIARDSMSRLGTGRVSSCKLLPGGRFELSFEAPVDGRILEKIKGNAESVALDNLTHTAAFYCTDNRFGSCRARGVLVSTPGPVRIEHNWFSSSGAAILVAGDSNYWFESGECHDVLIRENVFTDVCLSSGYQFGYGVISVCPVVPVPDPERPYHKNIRIENNYFDSPDMPVLYAYATKGISFTSNRVFRSPVQTGYTGAMLRFEYCSDILTENNLFVGTFPNAGIETVNCRP